MNNQEAYHKINKVLQKRVSKIVDMNRQSNYYDLSRKFFFLDHTAEVLENYRRIEENKIFDRILHDERMKKAYLKKEGRRKENLIEDFDFKFGEYKYFEDTAADRPGIGQGNVFQSSTTFYSEEKLHQTL